MAKAAVPRIHDPSLTAAPTACYGYSAAEAQPARGLGTRNHFVFPQVFGAGGENGLIRGAGFAAPGAGATTSSQFFDISGWSRYTLLFNFPVPVPVGGCFIQPTYYTDPRFANAWGLGASLPLTVGSTEQMFDSTRALASLGQFFTPYISWSIINNAAAPLVLTCALFLYDYGANG